MEIIKDLPEIFDEFEDKKKQSFLKVKEYKEKQIPIIGAYCSFFPREIAVAMGAIPVGLCSSANETVELAETVLPKNVCPLAMVMPYLIGVLIFILRIWLWEKQHVTARKKCTN